MGNQLSALSERGALLRLLGSSDPEQFELVALDMDGSLLNSKHALSDASIAKLQELSAAGVTIAIATGRSTSALYDHVARLDLKRELPIVCFNGAVGVRCAPPRERAPQQHEQLFSVPLPRAATDAVLAFAAARGLLVQYYVRDTIYVAFADDSHREFARRYAALTGASHTALDGDYAEALARAPPSKLLVMCDDVDAVKAELVAALPRGAAHCVRGSPPFFVEVLHPDVNKGAGLARLCAALDVPPARVVAFGDGDNDLEFLATAGLGLAMANARENVKAAADGVTARSNDDDGVAFELARLQREGLLPAATTTTAGMAL